MSSTMNYDHHPNAMSMDAKELKKTEKAIAHEAKTEEKMIKGVMKDLSRTEKAEAKADNQITRAENDLQKAKSLEQKRLRKQYDAELAHEEAVKEIHRAEQEVQLKIKHHEQLKEVLVHKHEKADAVVQAQEEHDRIRNVKLNALRSPEPLSEASRMVPEAQPPMQPVGQGNVVQPEAQNFEPGLGAAQPPLR